MSTDSKPLFEISQLKLRRYPDRKNDLLQAWDSADELIVAHFQEVLKKEDLGSKRVLVLNDSFGALGLGLQSLSESIDLTVYTDSYVSFQGIGLNSASSITPITKLNELSGVYDFVLARIPKNLSFFEDTLCRLTHHLGPQSKLICGYMLKHQASSSFELLNRYIGETSTSLAKKKARLIFADFQRKPVQSPYPLQVKIEGFRLPFIHHSNLFSREKLDIGTRFFLEHIPQGDFKTILDLGCANGIIGIAAKQTHPSAKIVFSDDSQMAIQSAQANFKNYFPEATPEESEFHWTNCFENPKPSLIDLVLCNPPFHQGNTMGDFIAWQMFTDSHRALVPGGMIRVIGNSHLKYHQTLKRIFGNSKIVASNNKFTIVDADK